MDYFRKFEYLEPWQIPFELEWHIGMRGSALRAPDVDEYDAIDAFLEHGTGLKRAHLYRLWPMSSVS